MLITDFKLLDCPYCGRPAEFYVGQELSDTSMVHIIKCSYLNCLAIQNALSGYSLDYKDKINSMVNDWNSMVSILNQNNIKNDNEKFCSNSCKYLNITEQNQSELFKTIHRILPHKCSKYQVRLMHGDAHPLIYKCKSCREENKIL